MRNNAAVAFLILLALNASAQVVELQAGTSTLLNASGAGANIYLPNSTATIGAGIVDGRFAFGASDTFSFHGYQITAGDSSFAFSAGTAGGLGIATRGLEIARRSPDSDVAAFVGATGLGYSLPFFSAIQPAHVGAGIYWSHRTRRHFQFSALSAFSGNQKTAAFSTGASWAKFQFAAAAGMLAGQKTATGQATYSPSRAFAATASRQELFWQGNRATVNSISAFSNLGHLNIHGAAIDSNSNVHVLAESAGASLRLGFAQFGGDAYQSNGQRINTQNVQENFRHWNFSQSFSESGPLHSYGFGGGYHNNRVAISVGQSVQFLPFDNGFHQVTQISISIRVPHSDASVSAQVSLLPTGAAYTMGGNSFVNGPLKLEQAGPRRHAAHRNVGRYEIRGVVLNKSGLPEEGAAVALGDQLVFTNHAGQFVARLRKAHPVAVQVRPEEFLTPGKFTVVRAPSTATPGTTITIEVTSN
jgi:hypothetical protein